MQLSLPAIRLSDLGQRNWINCEQNLSRQPAHRLFPGPSIKALGSLTPVGDPAACVPHENCVINQIEQARLLRGLRRFPLKFKSPSLNFALHIPINQPALAFQKRLLITLRLGLGTPRDFPECNDERGEKQKPDRAP